jgi:hypothetical protein
MTANVRTSPTILGWSKFEPYPVALTTHDELIIRAAMSRKVALEMF